MDIRHGSTIAERDFILEMIPCRWPYFHPDYINIMHGTEHDSAPEFFFLKDADRFVYYQYAKRDISKTISRLKANTSFDISSVFDYGGYYYNDEKLLAPFFEEFQQYCCQADIISEFVRFLPTNAFNFDIVKQYREIRCVTDHIVIDLNKQISEKDLSHSKKESLRKARREGLRCFAGNETQTFHELYEQTLNKNNAHDFFRFSKKILDDLCACKIGEVWYVSKDDDIIGGAFLLKGGGELYYFLAASDPRYVSLGGQTLLIYSIAQYYAGKEDVFFLGGGKNGIYEFKQGFSKQRLPYYIGMQIFQPQRYEELVKMTGSENNPFFPKYREKII